MRTYEVILRDAGMRLTVKADDPISAQKKAKRVYMDKIGKKYKGTSSVRMVEDA